MFAPTCSADTDSRRTIFLATVVGWRSMSSKYSSSSESVCSSSDSTRLSVLNQSRGGSSAGRSESCSQTVYVARITLPQYIACADSPIFFGDRRCYLFAMIFSMWPTLRIGQVSIDKMRDGENGDTSFDTNGAIIVDHNVFPADRRDTFHSSVSRKLATCASGKTRSVRRYMCKCDGTIT